MVYSERSKVYNYIISKVTLILDWAQQHQIRSVPWAYRSHVHFFNSDRCPPNCHFLLFCLTTIIKLVKIFICFWWQVKRSCNTPKNVTFGYHIQKLWRIILFGRCSKIVSWMYLHIDFEDVYRVMMVLLGGVQFWVYPPYMTVKVWYFPLLNTT